MEGSDATGADTGVDSGVDSGDTTQGDATQNELYDLSSVPEEYRGYVSDVVKEIQGNVTKRFQESSEYKKQWEPYESVGITDLEPQQVEQLVQFAQLANDPELFKEWWEEVGDELGFTDSLEEFDDDDDEDFDEDDDEDFDIEELIESAVQERIAPLLQQQAQQEQEQLLSEVNQEIESSLEALREEHGEFDEQVVLKLALAHDESDDPIADGFKDYLGLISNTERKTIEGKRNAPKPPEGPGTPNTNGESPTDFRSATEIAKERMRASSGQ